MLRFRGFCGHLATLPHMKNTRTHTSPSFFFPRVVVNKPPKPRTVGQGASMTLRHHLAEKAHTLLCALASTQTPREQRRMRQRLDSIVGLLISPATATPIPRRPRTMTEAPRRRYG